MNVLAIFAFILTCFILGTSYALCTIGFRYYENSLFNSMRMTFAFFGMTLIFIIRIIFQPKYRKYVFNSIKIGETSWWLSMLLGAIQYGFPYSLIALGQRSVSSSIVSVAQPLVPAASLMFASFLLPDEKFKCKKLIPHVLATIGCLMTCIPPFCRTAVEPPKWYDLLFIFLSVLAFGYGAVFYKKYLIKADFVACVAMQLFGAVFYSVAFSVIWNGPKANYYAWFKPSKYIMWPVILGIVYTDSCGILCAYICRVFGAVKSMQVFFGQIVVGIVAGVIFLNEFKGYKWWMHVLSWSGLVFLVISMFVGFYVDDTKEVVVDTEIHASEHDSVSQDSLLSASLLSAVE